MKNSVLLLSQTLISLNGMRYLETPLSQMAIIDRIFHHSNVVTIKGKSYRLKHLYEDAGLS